MEAGGGAFGVRDVEGWDKGGLGPLAEGSPIAVADHYVALSKISRRGRPFDTSAVLLAWSGFPSPRLRNVLSRFIPVDLVPETDPWSPKGMDEVDEIAESVVEDLQGAPDEPLARALRAMLRNVGRASPPGEGEMASRGFIADSVTLFMGGKIIDAEGAAHALGMETTEVGRDVLPSQFEWNSLEPPVPTPSAELPVRRIRELIDKDLPELVKHIPLVERLLDSFLLPQLGISLTDDERIKLSVLVAAPMIAGVEASIRWIAETNHLVEGESPEMVMKALAESRDVGGVPL